MLLRHQVLPETRVVGWQSSIYSRYLGTDVVQYDPPIVEICLLTLLVMSIATISTVLKSTYLLT